MSFGCIDPRSLSWNEFIYRFVMIRHAMVTLPAAAYAVVFAFVSVFNATISRQICIPKFGFGPQQIVLQVLGLMIGLLIGEVAGLATLGRVKQPSVVRPLDQNTAYRPTVLVLRRSSLDL